MLRINTTAMMALTLTLTGCGEGDRFDQISYFKGDNRHRIFVMRAPAGADIEATRTFGDKSMNTDGRFTMVYIYEADSETPPDLITLASDYSTAIEIMHSEAPPWRWRYVRMPDGGTALTDCKEAPQEGACKS